MGKVNVPPMLRALSLSLILIFFFIAAVGCGYVEPDQKPQQPQQAEKARMVQTPPKRGFSESDFKELFPRQYLCKTVPLFDNSLVVAFGVEPTKWNKYNEMIAGYIHVNLFGWVGDKWTVLWKLPEPVETDIWGGNP